MTDRLSLKLQNFTLAGLFCFIGVLLLSVESRGEEFLGIESPSSPTEEADDSDSSGVPEVSDAKEASIFQGSPSQGKWNFMLNGGSNGKGAVNGSLGVEYSSNPWIGTRLVGDYDRIEVGSDSIGTSYGGAIFLVGKVPNPSILKPNAGIGAGYSRWKRVKDQEIFSDGGSATLNAFWGIALHFTKHFGLGIQRHWLTYLGDTPNSFTDNEKSEDVTQISTSMGFFAYF